MMKENMIAGLFSGLLVTLLVVVFRSFWENILVPWFEDRVYKDIRIEGTWFSLYPEANDPKRQEIITLSRQGHTVTGTMTCTNGKDEGESYCLSGSFRNLILPLIYETADRSKTDRGSITLMAIHNGQRLHGKIAAYINERNAITDADVIWFRSKTDLANALVMLEKQKEQIKVIREMKRETEIKIAILEKNLGKKNPAATAQDPPAPPADIPRGG